MSRARWWLVLVVVSGSACSTQDMERMLDVDLGSGGGDGGVVDPGGLTFYKDVLPLAQQHCTSCHQPGGIGPFSMLTYEDTRPHTQVISQYVQTGLMPPWMPSDGCRDLRDRRMLTDAEKAIFTGWSDGAAAAGDPRDAPPPPPGSGMLPEVSVSMKMAQPYTPPSDESDHFQCFILDPKLAANADLVGYQVKPGDGAEVHHVVFYPADAADAQAADDATPDEVGWTCFGGPGTLGSHTIGGWVPGSGAVLFPPDTGIPLVAGQVLVMQVHYNVSYTTPAPDQTTVELQLADAPVAKHATMLELSNNSFAIPPGATGYPVHAQLKAPANGTVWGALPHAHTHGKTLHVQSDAGCMVDLPAWDFHWQQLYFFSAPMQIAKGQTVSLDCTYDNPGSTTLRFGEKTSDEMCLAFVYVTQ